MNDIDHILKLIDDGLLSSEMQHTDVFGQEAEPRVDRCYVDSWEDVSRTIVAADGSVHWMAPK